MSASEMVHRLIGCEWGRALSSPADQEPCSAQAVQRVMLHDGPTEVLVQVCPHHRDVLLTLTDPHREPS